jgi:hypothetical protein
MRLFIYKSLFVFLCIIIAYKLTIGSLIQNLEKKFTEIKSKENLVFISEKIRKELKSSVNKDNILAKEDAILLKKFLNKINSEIDNAN